MSWTPGRRGFRGRVVRVRRLRAGRGRLRRRTGIRRGPVHRVQLLRGPPRMPPRTGIRRSTGVCRGLLVQPVGRGRRLRRVPGTSPMSPPASWRLRRGGRRAGVPRLRRLRRVPPGCLVGSRVLVRLRRRGLGTCRPSSCRRRVPRGRRGREGSRLPVAFRLRLRRGFTPPRACRIRPARRGSPVRVVLRSRPVAPASRSSRASRVRLSSRMRRVLRSPPVRRTLPSRRGPRGCPVRRSLPVLRGPCITPRPCCPRPRVTDPAYLRRRSPQVLPAR